MGLLNTIIKNKKVDSTAKENSQEKKDASQAESKTAAKSKKETTVKAVKSPMNQAAVNKENTKDAYKILISPLVSEKATAGDKLNQYTFIINRKANKSEVKKAILAVYGVMPVEVNTIRVRGKEVRFGGSIGKRKDWKKAIITLPKGKSIKLYDN